MVNDLVELKKLTKSLIEQERKIQLGAKRWEAILNSLPVPIFITNDFGGIEFVNKAMEAEIGMSKEELEGSFCHEVVGGFHEHFKCYCSASEPAEEFFKEDLVLNDALYRHSRTPIKDEDGRVVGYICTLNNVTNLIKEYGDEKTIQLMCNQQCNNA